MVAAQRGSEVADREVAAQQEGEVAIDVSYSDAVMSATPDSHMLPTAHEPKLGPTCL